MNSSGTKQRFVLDTNVLVSALLLADSTPFHTLEATSSGALLFSSDTFAELATVLSRRKFDRYVPLELRMEFVEALRRNSKWISISEQVRVCRDPRDDKFLEVAVNGQADILVTGDHDLLALHPFRGISIFTPSAFLRHHGG